MKHVFISYKRNDYDSTFAEVLIHHVEKAGFNTWIDHQLDAGEEWRSGIDEAIKNAFALIIIMTPEAKASEYVTYEWAFAWGAGVKVIPVLLKHTPLHPRLEALQHLDFTDHTNRQWDKLINVLKNTTSVSEIPKIHIPQNIPFPIKEAITALDSDKFSDRKSAIESLAQANHPTAFEVLAGALQHPRPDVQVWAALTLIEFSDIRAVPGFTKALCDENDDVRHHALKIFNRIVNAEKVDLLIAGKFGLLEALKTKDKEVRYQVAIALAQIGDVMAVPGLIEALRDEDANVRIAVAWALGQIKDAAAAPELLKALHDEDANVRIAVAEALGQIEDRTSVSELANALHDKNDKVRKTVAWALGQIKDAVAVQGLIDVFYDDNMMVADAARKALLELGVAAIPELLKALRSENWNTRYYAASTLGEIGVAAMPGLLEALHDSNVKSRLQVVEALGKIGDIAAVPGLIEALRDEDANVRRKVAEAIGFIEDATAVAGLIEALHDRDAEVRRAASKALKRIGTPEALVALNTL